MTTYNQVTPEIIAMLEKITPGRVVFGEEINPDYGRDEMPIYGTNMPAVTIDILSTEEASEIMKICYANNIPVTTRGAGTGLCGGSVPMMGGVVVCTAKMNKILKIDTEYFSAIVQPGVFVGDLKDAALEQGLCYMPDPVQKFGSIGGNVSTNAGGMRAIKYGTTKEFVRAMTVVLADGEILKIGANVSKTSMGYNMTQLITGSEGTLGIITELTLKLIKAPKAELVVVVPFDSVDKALESVPKVYTAGFRPAGLEFFESTMLQMTEKHHGKSIYFKEAAGAAIDGYIILVFDGDSMDELESEIEALTEFFLGEGALDVMIADTPALKDELWWVYNALMEAMLEEYRLIDESDVVVPATRIAEFKRYMEDEAAQYDFDIYYLGHVGDGNLHSFGVSNDMDDAEFKRQMHLWMVALHEKAKEMGGVLTGEHGVGFGKIEYFRDFIGERNAAIQKGIKLAFDPKLILNPGKVTFTFDELA
ncbi:MAG: FAD-binding protein [Propionibacteriaceae bacterium]|jgi:glycolate oxidase|nr:FAD-binding protein [Propionibacteriaceae bacterium]